MLDTAARLVFAVLVTGVVAFWASLSGLFIFDRSNSHCVGAGGELWRVVQLIPVLGGAVTVGRLWLRTRRKGNIGTGWSAYSIVGLVILWFLLLGLGDCHLGADD